ncbi:hypothetical protein [Halorussus pelagicus]|uniref:hypothetical protein n=1 Tax=Halorussus pelagicus TaxID=2505977 RepID=UPI000FFB6FE4|nr:hypothetical protein [Halorussus pelagicus]
MAVSSRLVVLLAALSGVPLLLVDGFRSPPGLWYASGGIVAAIMLVVYTSISSFSHRTKPSSYSTPSPNTYSDSKAESTTDQTGSEQTVHSTESDTQKPNPAIGKDPERAKSRPSEDPELPSTTAKRSQRLPVDSQTIGQTTSYAETSSVRNRASRLTFRNKRGTSIISKGRGPTSGTDNTYFKPVDSSHEFKFFQVDTKFSYIDIDFGPEFVGLDPIPDLIEVDIGPSAVSQELIRSPVEIKISALLKSLLAPTPRRRDAITTDDRTETSAAIDGHTHQRANDAHPRRKQAIRDSQETQYGELDQLTTRTADPLTAFSGMGQSTERRPQSPDHEPEKRHQPTADVTGFGDWEQRSVTSGGYGDDRPSPGRDPLMEEAICTQDSGAAGESATDVGLDYSPPRWEPPQWDDHPFGISDFGLGLAEPEESAFGSVEQAELSFGAFDWEPSMSIEEPEVDPGFDEEVFEPDGFAESRQEMGGLPGFTTGNSPDPLLPDAECFFSDEELEEDWLSF